METNRSGGSIRRLPALLDAVLVSSLVLPALRYGVILGVATISLSATHREAVYFFPVEPLMSEHSARDSEWADIAVFFRGQEHPPVTKTIGKGRSHRKANAIFRSDPRACRTAFLAAVRSLQKEAWDQGGNAVLNVRSYGVAPRPKPEYRCVAGLRYAHVRLEGDVVRIDDDKPMELREAGAPAPRANAP